MFAQGKDRLFGQKRVAVVFERAIDCADVRFLFGADQQFRRRNARQFVEQRFLILRLSESKFARAEIGVGKTEHAVIDIDRAEIIRAFRVEQLKSLTVPALMICVMSRATILRPRCGSLV